MVIIMAKGILIDMWSDKCVKEILNEINSSFQLKKTVGSLVLHEKVEELEEEIEELKIQNQILKDDLKSLRVNNGKGKIAVIVEDLEQKLKGRDE
jgi:hypothetical protein